MKSNWDYTEYLRLSKGHLDYISIKLACVPVALIVFGILDIIMIIVGSHNLEHCTIAPIVPKYLVVGGAVGLLAKFLQITYLTCGCWEIHVVTVALYLFELVRLIAGSFWIYGIYMPNFDSHKGHYCGRGVYLFSFWFLTFQWGLIIVAAVLKWCCCCFPNFAKLLDWRA